MLCLTAKYLLSHTHGDEIVLLSSTTITPSHQHANTKTDTHPKIQVSGHNNVQSSHYFCLHFEEYEKMQHVYAEKISVLHKLKNDDNKPEFYIDIYIKFRRIDIYIYV